MVTAQYHNQFRSKTKHSYFRFLLMFLHESDVILNQNNSRGEHAYLFEYDNDTNKHYGRCFSWVEINYKDKEETCPKT